MVDARNSRPAGAPTPGRGAPPGDGSRPKEGGRGRRRRKGGGSKAGAPQEGGERPARPEANGPSAGGRPPKRDGRPAAGGRGGQRPEKKGARPAKEPRPEPVEPPFKHVLRRYGLVIYDTFAAARADKAAVAEKAAAYDQLNLVVRAEGPMDDPELLAIAPNVKVFAGTAWALIHDRRVADGWYDEPR